MEVSRVEKGIAEDRPAASFDPQPRVAQEGDTQAHFNMTAAGRRNAIEVVPRPGCPRIEVWSGRGQVLPLRGPAQQPGERICLRHERRRAGEGLQSLLALPPRDGY